MLNKSKTDDECAGLQRLGARSWVYTYRTPKTLITYTKKREPKINSDVYFTKIL